MYANKAEDIVQDALIPYAAYFTSSEEGDQVRRLPEAEFVRFVLENVMLPVLAGIVSAWGFEIWKPWLQRKGLLPKDEARQKLLEVKKDLAKVTERKNISEQLWTEIQGAVEDRLLVSGLPRQKAKKAAEDIIRKVQVFTATKPERESNEFP